MKKETFDNKIIVISGVTASGKTSFAIEIACFLEKEFGIRSEIVNADSMQLYNELKIITAHPTIEEQQKIRHNLFGVLSPLESSSVTIWLEMAKAEIQRINSEGKIAIICGGTGFYIDAIMNGISFIPEIPKIVRTNTREKFNRIGRDAFFEELSKIDKESVKRLHKNNTQRILRAYEVASFSGKTISEWWKESPGNNTLYNVLASFILLPSKDEVLTRSYIRILKMIHSGAIQEVWNFLSRYHGYNGSLCKAIGFGEIRELLEEKNLLDDKISDAFSQKIDMASIDTLITKYVDKIHANTKKYIKRQSTWFRHRFEDAKFLQGSGDDTSILNEAYGFIKNIKIH